ncbi:MAG: hypothetical protein MJY77_07735 [Bacteroidaceae bacterium]|nr:hypothetical protein [Bacteroidaceae bacterium]
MAGNAHLTEDRIDWTLTLNANEAEQKLHSLSTETKQLKDRQKELNQELKQAQVHPRKNAEQIRLLKEQLKECSSSIKHNGEEMKKLDRQMGVSNLSMSQLRRHASDLRKELDSISKSYHPEEWEKINRELVDTKNRIRELNEESAVFRTKDAVEATTLGNLLSDTITSITGKMRELIAEGVEMAESADGVQRAFNKLDKPGLLDNLRKATKGTVNDLQLMQAAVRAKDFRIPLEDLGKYLAYAQLKAQETGQSVEYLTDSIIMGLGRQSKQILDNLGLSAAEISEEVAKTGDFVSGVTAIVDRQLAEAGETYVSASDRAAQASVALKNAQLQLGQAMLPVKEVMNGMSLAGTKLLSFLVKYRQITFPLIAALTSLYLAKAKFNTVTRLGTALIKAQNAVLATQKVVVLAASAAYNLMTGNIT